MYYICICFTYILFMSHKYKNEYLNLNICFKNKKFLFILNLLFNANQFFTLYLLL